jgi:phage shock protein A
MFSRIANLFKGFLSLFISGLERQNPKALIEAEKENLRTQIARFNDNLANHAGFCERLLRQVKNLETQERDLAAKAAANLKVGNRNAAGQYALQLKTVKEQLEENRKQLEAAESTYQKLVKSRDVSVRDAQEKIEKLKRMMTETEMLEAQAELQEMATGMVSSIGGSGDTLNRVEEYLTERRDKAAGKARVAASSVDTSKVELMEAEQQALADAALTEFAAAYGIDAPAPAKAAEPQVAAPPPAAKEMGPEKQ